MKNLLNGANKGRGRLSMPRRTTHALFSKLGIAQSRTRRLSFAALFTALALVASFVGFSASAQTTQGQVGPINPDTGFPYWYQDSNGMRLELCLDANPLCLTTVPDPNRAPLVANAEVDSNFPDEAFWWSGDSTLTGANGVTGELILASEAAFSARVQNGDQISFGRIRIRIDNLVQGGTYRIVHPYGVDVFDNVSSGRRGINYTEDIGIGDFPNGFLNSRIKPFLTWDTYGVPATQIPAGDSAPPAGFIGDPTVNHKVKGSPIIGADGLPQNYFRIERLDPATRQVIQVVGQTNLFTVAGKLAGLAVNATPKGGTYASPQNVSLVASDPLAMIFFTLDGSDPSDMANPARTQYSAPIAMAANTTTTLKFVAMNGNLQSSVMTATYVIGAGGGPIDPPPTTTRLSKSGPINPNTGFPFWYEDANGLRLDICLDNNPLCLTTVPDTTRRALVAAQEADSNFPDEAFWWSGEAATTGANGVTAQVTLAAEAAFANKIQTGDQMAFGRVRIRVDNLVQGGSYKVTHPYGVDEFDNVSGGDGGINFTEDIGTTSFPNGILNSRVGPYLTWDTYGVDPALIPAGDAAPPAGYVGDPTVGHKVTGSPLNQNFFRVERLDPVTRQVIAVVAETDLFTVAGKLSSLNVVASPYGGAYPAGQALTLAASDETAVVYYTMTSTTDGSAPLDPSNPADAANTARIAYTGPIALPTVANSRSIVKFVATMTDDATGATITSPTMTESYTLDAVAPTVNSNPTGGTFGPAGVTVSLIASEPATIFFTADGSDPSNPANASRLRYVSPLTLTQNTTLKFQARDLAGNLSPIVTRTFVIDNVPPPAPSIPDLTAASDDGVSSTDNVTTITTPTFTGTAEAGSLVRLFIDGVERGSATATSTGSYTITTSVLATGTHTVTARATDAVGNVGPLSGSLTINITAAPATPAAPSALTVTIPSAGNGRANLAWADNSSNETGFEVERSTSATTGFVRITTVGADVRTFADTTAPRRVTVFYRVRAVNAAGASGYSNTASGITR